MFKENKKTHRNWVAALGELLTLNIALLPYTVIITYFYVISQAISANISNLNNKQIQMYYKDITYYVNIGFCFLY